MPFSIITTINAFVGVIVVVALIIPALIIILITFLVISRRIELIIETSKSIKIIIALVIDNLINLLIVEVTSLIDLITKKAKIILDFREKAVSLDKIIASAYNNYIADRYSYVNISNRDKYIR